MSCGVSAPLWHFVHRTGLQVGYSNMGGQIPRDWNDQPRRHGLYAYQNPFGAHHSLSRNIVGSPPRSECSTRGQTGQTGALRAADRKTLNKPQPLYKRMRHMRTKTKCAELTNTGGYWSRSSVCNVQRIDAYAGPWTISRIMTSNGTSWKEGTFVLRMYHSPSCHNHSDATLIFNVTMPSSASARAINSNRLTRSQKSTAFQMITSSTRTSTTKSTRPSEAHALCGPALY
jgi:hypothetical protein